MDAEATSPVRSFLSRVCVCVCVGGGGGGLANTFAANRQYLRAKRDGGGVSRSIAGYGVCRGGGGGGQQREVVHGRVKG